MPQQRAQQRRLARAVRPDDGDPLGPPHLEVDRPEDEVAASDHRRVEPHHDVAAARRLRELEPEVPSLPRLLDHVEPFDRPLTRPRLARELLRGLRSEGTHVLVRLGRVALRPRDALHGPLALRPGPLDESRLLGAVVLVVLLGVPAGDRTELDERVPSARELGALARVLVDLENARDRAFEELAVVAHDDEPAGKIANVLLEAIEPVEVEVVGRLVEEQHVEAAQQDRGQRDLRGLPTRQHGHRAIEHVFVEPHVGGDRPRPGVEVGRTGREVVVEGRGVRVVGSRLTPGQRGRRPLEVPRRPRPRRSAGRGTRAPSRRIGARAPAAGSRPAAPGARA